MSLVCAGTQTSWLRSSKAGGGNQVGSTKGSWGKSHSIISYLQNVLVLSKVAERVLAPSGRVASAPGVFGIGLGQAGRTNVWIRRKVDRFIHAQDGDVVVQSAGIELRMNHQVRDVTLDVRVELDVVVHVPLTQTHSQVVGSVAGIWQRNENSSEELREAKISYIR